MTEDYFFLCLSYVYVFIKKEIKRARLLVSFSAEFWLPFPTSNLKQDMEKITHTFELLLSQTEYMKLSYTYFFFIAKLCLCLY